jgi:hypothetical protein
MYIVFSNCLVFTGHCLVTAANIVDPSTFTFTASRPYWLEPYSTTNYTLDNTDCTGNIISLLVDGHWLVTVLVPVSCYRSLTTVLYSKILYYLSFTRHAICPAHPVLLDLIAALVSEECSLWSCSLCAVLHTSACSPFRCKHHTLDLLIKLSNSFEVRCR